MRCVAHGFDFEHQRIIDGQATRRIQHEHVIAFGFGHNQRAFGDLDRLLPRDNRERRYRNLPPQHRQLLLRRRAGDVERGHQHLFAVALGEAFGDFCRARGLAGALQADHHHNHGGGGDQIQGLDGAAQQFYEVVMNNLNDHLTGSDRFDHLRPNGAFLDRIDEIFNDR